MASPGKHVAKPSAHTIFVAQSSASDTSTKETCGQWLGRTIAETFSCCAPCLLPCFRCCCFCCVCCCNDEILSPDELLAKQFADLTVDKDENSRTINKLVEKAIKEKPARLITHKTLFSQAKEQVTELNLNNTPLTTQASGDRYDADHAPCVKLENLVFLFPNLTTLSLANCGIGGLKTTYFNCSAKCILTLSPGIPIDSLDSPPLSPAAHKAKKADLYMSRGLPELTSLNLSHNPIDGTFLHNLVTLPKLATLTLTSCPSVTSEQIAGLRKNHPNKELVIIKTGTDVTEMPADDHKEREDSQSHEI